MAEPFTQPGPSPSLAQNLAGKTVGRFAVLKLLGSGGMGEVYRARDTKLRRTVALKRIAPHLCANEKSRERLWKEALFASRLNDPHIAAIYDAFEEGNELFLVMEYVEGETLRHRRKKSLSLSEFLSLAAQCAAGIAAAHRAGIQHRDIKPENILLTPAGLVKLLDFGVARQLPGAEEGTTLESLSSEGFSGTLTYMAPEIIAQKPADARADIFSLGVVFYETLTGQNPFRAATFLETCHRILQETPPPLGASDPQLPAERYATAADLVVDLEALRRRTARGPASAVEPARRKRPSGLVAGATMVAATAALALAGIFAFQHFRRPVLGEHASILIADFENQTGQSLFDRTVTEATRQALEQSHYVHVIPRSQVLETARRMGRNGVTHLDRSLGRDICQRDNCRAVLAGTIFSTGSGYQITEQLVDPKRDEPVLVETASMSSPSGLYPAVDTLAKRLRKQLGESLAQIKQNSQPLQRVTTPSLEALQRYSRALDLYAAGDLEGFIPLAQSAVALDPNFAMAHLYLALAYDKLGRVSEARQEMALALQNIARVTERERYIILAASYEQQGAYEKAAEQYRLLTELYPDDLEAYRGLANASIWAGRPQDAIAAERNALRLSPHSAIDYSRLLLDLDRLNRFPDALAAAERARAQGVKSPQLHWGAGLAYLGLGDSTKALDEFQRLGSEGGTYEQNLASFYRARVFLFEGHLAEAATELRTGLVLDEKMRSESWVPARLFLLARLEMNRGQQEKAREVAEKLNQVVRSQPTPEGLRDAGILAVELQNSSAAQWISAKLRDMSIRQADAFTKSCYYNLKGVAELAGHQPAEAIQSEQRSSVFFPSFEPQEILGRAYDQQQDWPNAALAYRQYLEFKGAIFRDDSPAAWVLAHLSLARVLARAGQTQESLKYYDDFLQLWSNADPDLPALRQARAERARLAATNRSKPPETKGGPGKQ